MEKARRSLGMTGRTTQRTGMEKREESRETLRARGLRPFAGCGAGNLSTLGGVLAAFSALALDGLCLSGAPRRLWLAFRRGSVPIRRLWAPFQRLWLICQRSRVPFQSFKQAAACQRLWVASLSLLRRLRMRGAFRRLCVAFRRLWVVFQRSRAALGALSAPLDGFHAFG